MRARALDQRAHLPQIVINDRLAAIEPSGSISPEREPVKAD
jgi:hypothetical protein